MNFESNYRDGQKFTELKKKEFRNYKVNQMNFWAKSFGHVWNLL